MPRTAIEGLIDVSAVEKPDEFTHEVAIDDDLIVELPRIVTVLAVAPRSDVYRPQ